MIAPVRVAFVALAVALAGSALGQGVTSRTVVLGQSAPLSGEQRALGEAIRQGALAYLRKLNDAGGVHGRRIELATLDDAGDAARALANTRRFIEEFKVFALFGYPEASLTPEVLALAREAGAPHFGPVTGAGLARQPEQPVFTVRAGRAEEIDAVIGHYASLGLKRFALLRREDAAGAEFHAAARASLERRGLPALADAPLQGDDAAAAAREAFVAGPDVVLVALPQPPAAHVVSALKRDGHGAQIVALSPTDPAQLAQALGPVAAGVALAQPLPPLERVSLPLVADYRRAMQAERAPMSPASLEGYLSAKVLAEAIRRAGPALTRASLLLALEAMSFYDAGGHVVSYSRNRRQGSARIYLLSVDSAGSLLH